MPDAIHLNGNAAPGSPMLRAWPPADAIFSFVVENEDRIVGDPSGTNQVTVDDSVTETVTVATVNHEKHIYTSAFATFESLNPAAIVAEIDGHLTYIGFGNAQINIRNGKCTQLYETSLSQDVGSSTTRFVGYVAGSAAKHMCDAIDSRIVGKNTSHLPLFTTQDHSGQVYTRNPGCWGADLDLTMISPWNSNGQNKKAGCLVSPRHLVSAKHYDLLTGSVVRFVGMNGQVCDRTVTNSIQDANSDWMISVLNADVDEFISFAKVLGPNAFDYLPSLCLSPGAGCNPFHPIAALCTDQEEKLNVQQWFREYPNYGVSGNTLSFFQPPTDAQRLLMYEYPVSGDSGSPVGVLVNNEFVLLTTWLGSTGGPSIQANYSEMNAAMTTLGGGYQLTPVDLTGFNFYG